MSRVEFDGKDLEEAIAKAAASLSLPPEKVKFSVLSMGARGFLGLGRRKAKISIDPGDPVLDTEAAEQTDKPVAASSAKPDPKESGHRRPPRPAKETKGDTKRHQATSKGPRESVREKAQEAPPERIQRPKARPQKSTNTEKTADQLVPPPEPALPLDWSHVPPPMTRPGLGETVVSVDGDEAASLAIKVLREILGHMGLAATLEAKRIGNRLILSIDSPDNALLIGTRGASLEALQLLTGKIVTRRLKENNENSPRVVVDAADYLARRHYHLLETLGALAGQVRQTRRPQIMPGLGSAERRMLQLALRPYKDLALLPDRHREGLVISVPHYQRRR